MPRTSQIKFRSKIYFVILLLLAPFATANCAPYITIPAETLDPYTQEITLYTFLDDSTTINILQAPVFQYDFSLLKNTEIDVYVPFSSLTAPRQQLKANLPNASGLGDINIQLKYRFIQETSSRPQISFMPVIFFPTGNVSQSLGNGKMWYQFPFGIQKSWGDWASFANIGYAISKGPNDKNYFLAGAVLEKKINNKWQLGCELYTQTASNAYVPSFTLLNFGATYQYNKHWSSSASLGHSITGLKQWIAYLDIDWV